MKINNETDYIKKILRPYLEDLGFKVHKHTERFSSGYPDLTALMDGLTVYIEAKIDKKCPTAIQMKELTDLARHGAQVYIFSLLIGDGFEKITLVSPDGENRIINRHIFEIRVRR